MEREGPAKVKSHHDEAFRYGCRLYEARIRMFSDVTGELSNTLDMMISVV